MTPTLVPGDYVISTKLFKSYIKKNSIIIFLDRYCSFIIKRVSQKKSNYIVLKNDNIRSESIFCNKPINLKNIEYVVILKIKKKYLKRILKIF